VATGGGVGEEQAVSNARTAKASGFIGADVSQRARARSIFDVLPGVVVVSLMVTVLGCGSKSAPPATAETVDNASATPIVREPLRISELQVADMVPDDLRVPGFQPIAERAVKDAFIDPARTFARADPDDAGGCKASVQIGYALMLNGRPVADAEAGEARAVVEGELFCPDPKNPKEIEQFRLTVDDERAFGSTAGGTSKGRLEEAVKQVAHDAADGLFGQARTRHQPDDTILANLSASASGPEVHTGILAESASESGERHLVAAVPDLIRLTAHPNTRVAVRAGAALGLLKVSTPEVLRALVRMTEGPIAQRHIVAIHALADLGTPEARRYLDNLATGHPELSIRELARARLRDLDAGTTTKIDPDDDKPEPVPDPVP